MSRRLAIQPKAEAELTDAFNWYEDRREGLGFDFLFCIDALFSAMLRNPQQYPRVYRTVRRALVRRFPYEVFFTDDPARVVVLAVHHAGRNPERWRERI